jgi:hypothetical protein
MVNVVPTAESASGSISAKLILVFIGLQLREARARIVANKRNKVSEFSPRFPLPYSSFLNLFSEFGEA